MKKLLVLAVVLVGLAVSSFASLTVESAVNPVASLNFVITQNVIAITSNQQGFWFIQNTGTNFLWVSPFKSVKADGSGGGYRMLPYSALYLHPLAIGGEEGMYEGSRMWAVAESGTVTLNGWCESF
jgi:hypothetical protein